MRTATMNRPFRRPRRAALISLVAAAFILGCGGDDPTAPPQPLPEPGELQITLSSAASVGAVVLTVTGTGIASPAAAGGARAYHDLSGGTLRAVLAGSSLSGEILRFAVPDVRQVAAYQVTVEQAAGTANQPLAASGISVSVVR